MIFSNPTYGMLNYENKNQGGNPYEAKAAGLLQQIQAQNALQKRIFDEAAAKNQAEANKGGFSMNQLTSLGKMLKGADPQSSNPSIAQPSSMDEIGQVMNINGYNSSPIPNPVLPAMSEGLQGMMPNLMKASQMAYPDNPMMQKVALSQAILESRLNGNPSSLATNHNNFFGIKSNKYYPGTNGSVDMQTTEYVGGSPARMNQGFASNNSMNDSFAQHAALMNGASRYAPVLKASSPDEAFSALQTAGYATDPNYASKLRSIYGQYVSPYYR